MARAITDDAPTPMPPPNANSVTTNGKAKPIAANASVPTMPRNTASPTCAAFSATEPIAMKAPSRVK